MPVRGEEETKDVQINNLLKANKGLDEKLAEYRCLGTIEEIKEIKEFVGLYCMKAFAKEMQKKEEVDYEVDYPVGPTDDKEGKKRPYSLLCHIRADAMLKGKLHEYKGLENELEAVDIFIKRIKPLGELKSTQVIASIITKHIPWFRWF